jgi:tetratricopeptide (TPR) repeat protein
VRDDRRRKSLDVDDVEQLLVSLGGEPTSEPEPLPSLDETGDESGAETEGAIESEAETEGEIESESETEGEIESETEGPEPQPRKHDGAKAKTIVVSAATAYEAGNDRDAETLFHQALGHDRRNVEALVGLHQIHFDRGEWRQALDFARRAASLRPKRPDLQMFVGDSCMKVLDYDCAREHYENAQQLGDTRAKQRLRILAERLGGSG